MFKSWHNFKIKRLTGEIIDLYEAGVMVLGFDSPVPGENLSTEEIDGLDGYIDLGVTLPGRTAKARFCIEAIDFIDFDLKAGKVYKIFDSREPFYIIRDMQPGKQILVRKSGGFSPSLEAGFIGEFEIEFKSPSPYWESVADTTEQVDFSSHLWAIGMGFNSENEYLYSFKNVSSFIINNPGDAEINPREYNRPLVIQFKGASDKLQIKNRTTGEMFQYNDTTADNDTLKIDGVRVFKNGSSVFGSTNRQLIKLIKGKNDILITGATRDFTIEFITKFYYL